MFEFIDLELIKINVFALLVSIVFITIFKNTRRAIIIYFSILLFVDLSYLYYSSNKAQENIKAFKKAKELQCMQTDPMYRVSLEDKWIIKEYYFIKDSLMIRADKCDIL